MSQQSNSAAVQPQVLFRPAATPTQSTVVTYKSEGNNGCVQISGNGYQQTFSRLPRRKPVDIQFENIGFTASLGFRKGKAF